jgi:hypothetical protein
MRMKWKLPIYFSCLVLAIAATAVSCSKDSTAPEQSVTAVASPRLAQQTVEDLQAQYGWMGRFHTEGLEYVYGKLSQSPRASKAEKCRIAVQAIKEFARTFSKGPGFQGIATGPDVGDACSASSQFSASRQLQVGATPQQLKPRTAISTQASSLLYQIQGVFDLNLSLSATEGTIYYLERVAAGTLIPSEAGAVIGVGSIAISSTEYWNANLNLWQSGGVSIATAYNRLSSGTQPAASVLGTPPVAPRYGLSATGKRILKADVSAAVSSLLRGWFLGAVDLEVAAYSATVASAIAAI